jgi:hypothetical protein
MGWGCVLYARLVHTHSHSHDSPSAARQSPTHLEVDVLLSSLSAGCSIATGREACSGGGVCEGEIKGKHTLPLMYAVCSPTWTYHWIAHGCTRLSYSDCRSHTCALEGGVRKAPNLNE